MRLLLNKLAIAWLVLSLMVAPLEAMASPVSMVADNDCAVMQTSQHSPDMHQAGTHAKAQCKRCTGQCCDDGQCAENGCFSAHNPLSMPTASLSVSGTPLVSVLPDYHENLSSHTPTPPFRPPV
jgi:hypothetical protein